MNHRRRIARVAALVGLLVPLMLLPGCGDLTVAPGAEDEPVTLSSISGYHLLEDEDPPACLPESEGCSLVEKEGEQHCVCQLPGIAASVPGGSGYAGPYPWTWWPTAPGFPDPDFGAWPEPPGGGTWPNLPPPESPEECDPYGFINSCFWTAELSCTAQVTRGSEASCTLTMDPFDALDEVIVWTFNGSKLNVSSGHNSTTWNGTMLESGKVRVDFRAKGRDATAMAQIQVTPRFWSWDSSYKSFAQGSPGELDNCMDARTGLTADKFGCRSGTGGAILINPGPNQGFTISQGDGPNAGGWYVTNPTTRMDVRTQVNRKYRLDETKYAVNGVAAVTQACTAAFSPNPVPPQNNYTVNTDCDPATDFMDLYNFAWSHEADHLTAIQAEAANPVHDIYAQWDLIVASSQNAAFTEANNIQNVAIEEINDAGRSTHTGSTTDFDIWYHTGSGVWQWATVTVLH